MKQLNFEVGHNQASTNVNILRKKLSTKKKAMLAGLALSSLGIFTGCANNNTIVNTVEQSSSNKKDWHYEAFNRNMSFEEAKINEILKNNDLYKISDNKDKIQEIISENDTFILYEYSINCTSLQPNEIKNGRVSVYSNLYSEKNIIGWTTDPNLVELTGNTMIGHLRYFGYKIIKNDEGTLQLEKSSLMDSIDKLIDAGYKYIPRKFYERVDENNQSIENIIDDDIFEIENRMYHDTNDYDIEKVKKGR